MATKRSWRAKLQDDKDLPKRVPIPAQRHATWGRGTILIAAPREFDELMRKVRKGKLTTIDELRRVLATRHAATMTCPMTAGIFANLAARAAEEAEQAGQTRVTPYWRTLKARGELNPKFPGGLAVLRSRLEAEGHEVEVRGQRMFVVGFEARLQPLAE